MIISFFRILAYLIVFAHIQLGALPADTTITNLLTGVYGSLGLNSLPGQPTQTMAYLNKNGLRENLNDRYSDKVNKIGLGFFKHLFSSVMKKEQELRKSHRVFYHGQEREFILFHDIYNGLYKIANKKALQDFIFLRTPDDDFKKFKSIKDFLHHAIENGDLDNDAFDHQSHIRKQLLSVNPSLFSNTHNLGECTFHYFLDSSNIASPNMLRIVNNVFAVFEYQKYFLKYKNTLEELLELLSRNEKEKTGALLQIFVPEKLVNALAYRCRPCGDLFYDDKKPETHPAIKDLDDYEKETSWTDYSFDKVQFRLLINKAMLDPRSGIKFFRYCNETDNVKKYMQKLDDLLKNIEKDIRIAESAA